MGVTNWKTGQPTIRLTNGALACLQAMTPAGYTLYIHVTLTDDFPLAVAYVIISAESAPIQHIAEA